MGGSYGPGWKCSRAQKWVDEARADIARLQAELRAAEEELLRAEENLIRVSCSKRLSVD